MEIRAARKVSMARTIQESERGLICSSTLVSSSLVISFLRSFCISGETRRKSIRLNWYSRVSTKWSRLYPFSDASSM